MLQIRKYNVKAYIIFILHLYFFLILRYNYNTDGGNMNKKHYVDLSDIKENDLDNTASFTDLMSRSEKLEHKRKKEEEQTRELKEILIKDLIKKDSF